MRRVVKATQLRALVCLGFVGAAVLLGAAACGSANGTDGGGGPVAAGGEPIASRDGSAGQGVSGASEGGASGTGESSGGSASLPTLGSAGDVASGAAGTAGGDLVFGSVVAYSTQLGLENRTVRIGSEQTVTDAGGQFVLRRPSSHYDVAIIDPDGVSISVYRNLGSAAPVLVHRPFQPHSTTRFARLSGNASGALGFPIAAASSNVLSLYLLSQRGTSRTLLGGGAPPYGPAYSSNLAWNGEASLRAQLFAFATYATSAPAAGGPTYAAAATSKAITLVDGSSTTEDVVLNDIKMGVLAGSASLPAGVTVTRFEQYYRFPDPAGCAISQTRTWSARMHRPPQPRSRSTCLTSPRSARSCAFPCSAMTPAPYAPSAAA